MNEFKEYKDLSCIEKLNLYRNKYFSDGNSTEQGIIANAINEIFCIIQSAKIAKIEAYKEFAHKLDACATSLIGIGMCDFVTMEQVSLVLKQLTEKALEEEKNDDN